MKICENLCKSLKIDENLRKSMKIYKQNLRKSMKITDPKENHYQNELTNFHEGHDLYYKKNQRDWNIE